MSEMIETIAKAILKARQERGLSGQAAWEYEPVEIQTLYCECARAALQAIREPSEAMVQSGGCEIYDRRDDLTATQLAPHVWQAMIDAALAE